MSRVFFSVVLAISSVFLVNCSGKDKPEPAKPAEKTVEGHPIPARTPDGTYTVKGEVAGLPVAGDKRTQFRVHHEAIDNFKDREGKTTGMNSMTMDFPPAKGVDLSNLKKGDKVSMTFSVWWGNTPTWMVTKIEKLPDDTMLTFGKANPPSAPAEPKVPASK
jgi:Cu/Ag efflux protein CusF